MKIIRACVLRTAGVAVLTLTGITAPTAAAVELTPSPSAAGVASVLLPGATGGQDGGDTGWG